MALHVEPFGAQHTLILSLLTMGQHVAVKVCLQQERFAAHFTPKVLVSIVHDHVGIEVNLHEEPLST